MDLVPIGTAARRLGVNTSTLRYYEDRGLVRPVRRGGQRHYSREDLRRLAFIRITHRLGLRLRTASAVLEEPSEQWRVRAREQLTELAELIDQAREAQWFLEHTVRCPAEHPVRECPRMIGLLDRRLAGATYAELVAEAETDYPANQRADRGQGPPGDPAAGRTDAHGTRRPASAG